MKSPVPRYPLRLQRLHDDGDTTAGIILCDGVSQMLYSVEDQANAVKVAGETRIPAGDYKLVAWVADESLVTEENKHCVKYAPGSRYAKKHAERGMIGVLEISGIHNFSAVLVHAGNDDDSSEGCILPNLSFSWVTMRGGSSRTAVKMIHDALLPRLLAGEQLYVRIVDECCKRINPTPASVA